MFLVIYKYIIPWYILIVNNKFFQIGGIDMPNIDVRVAAMTANVKLWQISEALRIRDCNLSRKLRRELPQAEKENILAIIGELAAKREVES